MLISYNCRYKRGVLLAAGSPTLAPRHRRDASLDIDTPTSLDIDAPPSTPLSARSPRPQSCAPLSVQFAQAAAPSSSGTRCPVPLLRRLRREASRHRCAAIRCPLSWYLARLRVRASVGDLRPFTRPCWAVCHSSAIQLSQRRDELLHRSAPLRDKRPHCSAPSRDELPHCSLRQLLL